MRLIRADKGTQPVPLTGARASIQLDNRKRNHRLIITIAAVLAVAGAPAGAVRNDGRLSTVISHAVNENGEDTYGPSRAWMLRQLAEYSALQPLAATTLPASGALPIGSYPLFEQYEINFADRRIVGPSETAFMERDPGQYLNLDTFLTPGVNPITTLVAPAGGSTVTLSNFTVTVEQVYADAAGASLPFYKPRLYEQMATIAGANPQEIINVKTQQRLRKLAIGAEGTVGADGGVIVVADVINAFRLIGDGGFNVVGPNQSNFVNLVQSQRAAAGGDVTFRGAVYVEDFANDGRLSNTIFPLYQTTNFRYEANVQPSVTAGVTSSRVVYVREELTRPDAVGDWAVVSAALPEWAIEISAS